MIASRGRNTHGSFLTFESSSMRTARVESTCVLFTSSAMAMSRNPVASQILS